MSAIQVTADTNLMLECWKDQNKRATVEKLVDRSRKAHVNLVVTARLREDMSQPPLSNDIDHLSELNVQEGASVTRIDIWVFSRDMVGDDAFKRISQQLDKELRRKGRTPPDWRDWDNLHTHVLSRRSVFLTWDERILEVAPELHTRLGINIKSPESWLAGTGLLQYFDQPTRI